MRGLIHRSCTSFNPAANGCRVLHQPLRVRTPTVHTQHRQAWKTTARSAAGDSIPVVKPDAILPPPSRGSQYGSQERAGGSGSNGGSGSTGGSGGNNQPSSDGGAPNGFQLLMRALWGPFKTLVLYVLWTFAIFTVLKFVWSVLGVFIGLVGSLLGGVVSLLGLTPSVSPAMTIGGGFELPGAQLKDVYGDTLVVEDAQPVRTAASVAKNLANAALIYLTLVGSLLFFAFFRPSQ